MLFDSNLITAGRDPFNPRHIREASARINALRFFEPISISSKPGSDDSNIIIDLKVKEMPTGSLTFGASYGQAAGFGGNVKIEQRNLLGRGQRLSLSLDTQQILRHIVLILESQNSWGAI